MLVHIAWAIGSSAHVRRRRQRRLPRLARRPRSRSDSCWRLLPTTTAWLREAGLTTTAPRLLLTRAEARSTLVIKGDASGAVEPAAAHRRDEVVLRNIHRGGAGAITQNDNPATVDNARSSSVSPFVLLNACGAGGCRGVDQVPAAHENEPRLLCLVVTVGDPNTQTD